MTAAHKETTYLEEHLGEPNLPIVAASDKNTITNPLACALEVSYFFKLQSRKKDPVPLNKLMEGMTDGIASSANPNRGFKTSSSNYM